MLKEHKKNTKQYAFVVKMSLLCGKNCILKFFAMSPIYEYIQSLLFVIKIEYDYFWNMVSFASK